MTTLEEYRLLADMNSRGACPRCQGYGFLHLAMEKHDKPVYLRCKRCSDCTICASSGVTTGVLRCERCQANGFIHPANTSRKHSGPAFTRCFDCIVCQDCRGACVLDKKRIEEMQKLLGEKIKARESNIQAPLLQLHDARDILDVDSDMLALPPLVHRL